MNRVEEGKSQKIEANKEMIGKIISEKVSFLSKDEKSDLIKFLAEVNNYRKVLITATRVDIDADSGKPFHHIELRVEKTKKDDSLYILNGIRIYDLGIEDLHPAAGWKKTIGMTKQLKNLLGEIGIPTATFQNVPEKVLKRVTEYRQKPLVL